MSLQILDAWLTHSTPHKPDQREGIWTESAMVDLGTQQQQKATFIPYSLPPALHIANNAKPNQLFFPEVYLYKFLNVLENYYHC